tara:strand:+ start:61 stop:186 length:126 start_codon:yes stop_codon:yes gene_type:complete
VFKPFLEEVVQVFIYHKNASNNLYAQQAQSVQLQHLQQQQQ